MFDEAALPSSGESGFTKLEMAALQITIAMVTAHAPYAEQSHHTSATAVQLAKKILRECDKEQRSE